MSRPEFVYVSYIRTTPELLYRALTVLPTLAIGLLAAATWRTHHPGESVESTSDP